MGLHSIVARWLGLRPPVYAGRTVARGLSLFPEGHGLERGAIQQFVEVGKRAGFVALNDKEVYWFFAVMGPPKGTINRLNLYVLTSKHVGVFFFFFQL